MHLLAKLFRLLIGLLLIPACVAVTYADIVVVQSIYPSIEATISNSGWALICGFMLWALIYVVLPRPMRTYVLAHELTHALWGWVMGAKVRGLQVGKQGGSVTLSRTNFLVTLAPYFFPLYTVCVIALYYVLALFLEVAPYQLIWLGLVGFTWSFHLTFSLSSLLQKQTDIRSQGHIFSYAVIYLMNLLGIGVWVVAIAAPTFVELGDAMMDGFAIAYGTAWEWCCAGVAQLR